MSTTRGGEVVSPQIGFMGEIDLSSDNFKSEDVAVNIKNENPLAVVLEVNLWGMPEDEFITTIFEPGWNVEIVREIKQQANITNLKYGY